MPRINQLPSASSVASTDVVAVDTQDKTYRVPKSTLFDGYYTAAEVDAAIAQSTASMMSEGTITVAPGVTNISSVLNKTGNIVSFTATLQRIFTETSGSVKLCTLPAGFRPKQITRGAGYNGTKHAAITYTIQLNGDVYIDVNPDAVDTITQNIMINASLGV